MYRYAGCRWPPQRITGDAYVRLMGLDREEHYDDTAEFRVKWTPENNEYLIELVEEGKAWTEIADIFHAIEVNLRLHYARLVKKGRAKKVVRTRILTPELMEYVVANLNKQPVGQLAQDIGYHICTVYIKLHQLGWTATHPRSRAAVHWEKVA